MKGNPAARKAHLEESAAWRIKYPVRRLLAYAKNRAKSKNVPFMLTESDLLPLPKVCPVLGIQLIYNPTKKHAEAASISVDEVIPGLGYVKGNVAIISTKANKMKGSNTSQTLSRLLAYVERYERGIDKTHETEED
jgi:hypothetical protein